MIVVVWMMVVVMPRFTLAESQHQRVKLRRFHDSLSREERLQSSQKVLVVGIGRTGNRFLCSDAFDECRLEF